MNSHTIHGAGLSLNPLGVRGLLPSVVAKISRVLLRSTFAGTVVRPPDIGHCAPDLLQNTDLIVLPMPADSDTHFGAMVQVLKECVHPVLFVPSTEGIVERSTS